MCANFMAILDTCLPKTSVGIARFFVLHALLWDIWLIQNDFIYNDRRRELQGHHVLFSALENLSILIRCSKPGKKQTRLQKALDKLTILHPPPLT